MDIYIYSLSFRVQTEDGTFLMGTDMTSVCQEQDLPWLPAAVSADWLLDLLAESIVGVSVISMTVMVFLSFKLGFVLVYVSVSAKGVYTMSAF